VQFRQSVLYQQFHARAIYPQPYEANNYVGENSYADKLCG